MERGGTARTKRRFSAQAASLCDSVMPARIGLGSPADDNHPRSSFAGTPSKLNHLKLLFSVRKAMSWPSSLSEYLGCGSIVALGTSDLGSRTYCMKNLRSDPA
jgi:hypothetical protein